MLRLSRAEMSESGFKDGVVDQVYDGIINYLSVEAASIGFPELVVPAVLQVGPFLSIYKAGCRPLINLTYFSLLFITFLLKRNLISEKYI